MCHTQRYPLLLEIIMLIYRVVGHFVGLKAFKRVVHFTTFSGLLKETGWYSCHSGSWDMVQSRISIIFWMSSPFRNFVSLSNPGTGRVLCHICMWQKISASAHSGSLQVEVLGIWPMWTVEGGLSWSPQIMRTIEQMTADKLQRVGWP